MAGYSVIITPALAYYTENDTSVALYHDSITYQCYYKLNDKEVDWVVLNADDGKGEITFDAPVTGLINATTIVSATRGDGAYWSLDSSGKKLSFEVPVDHGEVAWSFHQATGGTVSLKLRVRVKNLG